MLNKNTFGDTPAAMYLAERLNVLNDKKLTRKISAHINRIRAMLAEMVEAHNVRVIKTHTLSSFLSDQSKKIDDMVLRLVQDSDELAVNLMANVLKGDIKRITHKARKIIHIERAQHNLGLTTKINRTVIHNTDGVVIGHEVTQFCPTTTKLDQIVDLKQSWSLQIKSRNKLKRLGKECKLY
jgi:hypothetical protein